MDKVVSVLFLIFATGPWRKGFRSGESSTFPSMKPNMFLVHGPRRKGVLRLSKHMGAYKVKNYLLCLRPQRKGAVQKKIGECLFQLMEW